VDRRLSIGQFQGQQISLIGAGDRRPRRGYLHDADIARFVAAGP
jgi:hypothetical protein